MPALVKVAVVFFGRIGAVEAEGRRPAGGRSRDRPVVDELGFAAVVASQDRERGGLAGDGRVAVDADRLRHGRGGVGRLDRTTVAVPVTAPLLAVTVQPVMLPGAVNSPAVPIVPPLLLQVKVCWLAIDLWNWSNAWAVNCCVAPCRTVGALGERTMLVNVWFTTSVPLNRMPVALAARAVTPVGAGHRKGDRDAARAGREARRRRAGGSDVADQTRAGVPLIALPNWSIPGRPALADARHGQVEPESTTCRRPC